MQNACPRGRKVNGNRCREPGYERIQKNIDGDTLRSKSMRVPLRNRPLGLVILLRVFHPDFIALPLTSLSDACHRATLASLAEETGNAMHPFLILTLLGVTVCTVVTQYMIRVGIMDVPGHRSAHARPVPKGGGVAMMMSLLAGAVYVAVFHPFPAMEFWKTGIVLAAALGLAWFSWRDDVYQYPPGTKLRAQLIASMIVTICALWGLPLTLLTGLKIICGMGFVIYVTNALNFMDGINGLAVGTIACCGLILTPLLLVSAQNAESALFFSLGIAALTFLYFNYPKARIFMSDVGSQPCGLLLGWGALLFMRNGTWSLLVPLMLMGILFDVTFTLIRRALKGENLMQAHCGHLYQIAGRAGVSKPLITLVHWGFIFWGGLVGLTFIGFKAQIILALIPQFIWAGYVIRRARRHHLAL